MSAPQPPNSDRGDQPSAPPPGAQDPSADADSSPAGTPAGPSGEAGSAARPDLAKQPANPDPTAPPAASSTPTYDFQGEQLDFDPYRFGAPEEPPPMWSANPPAAYRPGGTGSSSGHQSGNPDLPQYAPGDVWGGAGSGGPGSGSPGSGGPGAAGNQPGSGSQWAPGGSASSSPPGGSQSPPAGSTPGAVYPPPGYVPPGTSGSAGQPSAGSPPTGSPSAGQQPAVYPPTGYPPPQYPTSGYPTPAGGAYGQQVSRGNGVGITGFVLGLVGVVLFITTWIATLFGIAGLVCSIIGARRGKRGAGHGGLAITGIVLSIVAIIASIVTLVFFLSQYDLGCLADLGTNTDGIQACEK